MPSRRQVLLAAPGVAALAKPGRPGSPALAQLLRARMRSGQIPGLQVAIVRRGELEVLDSLGLADIENPAPVTGRTVFQIASCTKAFVGVAVMQLVEAGRLDLDAPISRYLDGLPAAWRSVTVEQLASHTSGLPDIVDDLGALHLVVEGDIAASWAKVQTLPPPSAPGASFSYNQTNYLLLGKIISSVSGEAFASFIRRRQFDVAGMAHTVYGDDHDVVPLSARTYTPYVQVGGRPTRTASLFNTYIEFPPELRTCGGVCSTALDLARWIIALDRGSLMGNESLARLRRARPLNDGRPGAWGIGGWVIDRPRRPCFMGVGAGKCAFAIYPEDQLAVVVLTNLSADMGLPFLDEVATRYLAGA
jgi:CubicO group peptidase (beta-lactamase class C family)